MSDQLRMLNEYGHPISQSVHAWADWARKIISERSERAAEVIAHGGLASRWLSDQDIARRQVEESRAEHAIIDGTGPRPEGDQA